MTQWKRETTDSSSHSSPNHSLGVTYKGYRVVLPPTAHAHTTETGQDDLQAAICPGDLQKEP